MDGESGACEDGESPLAGMTWPAARTLYRFFVVWAEDTPACCPGAESLQAAVTTVAALMQCLQCGQRRQASVEIVELVI